MKFLVAALLALVAAAPAQAGDKPAVRTVTLIDHYDPAELGYPGPPIGAAELQLRAVTVPLVDEYARLSTVSTNFALALPPEPKDSTNWILLLAAAVLAAHAVGAAYAWRRSRAATS